MSNVPIYGFAGASPPPQPAAAAAPAYPQQQPHHQPQQPAYDDAPPVSNSGVAGTPPQMLVRQPMALQPPPAPVREENGRVLEKVDKPFVYGSAAFWLGKVPEGAASHKWTVFLRGLEHEDLSYFIESVTFRLHDTFAEPTRVLRRAPYEVTESGWGEFVVGIQVDFLPMSGLEPVKLEHQLKLFPLPPALPHLKRPVMSEVYDEFVFVHPPLAWHAQLHSGPTHKLDGHPLVPFVTTPEFAREEDKSIATLTAHNEHVQQLIEQQRVRLFAVEQEIDKLTQRL